MGYAVDWEAADLGCKSEADARAAGGIVNSSWLSPRHLVVTPWEPPLPGLEWYLAIENFEGDHWFEDEAWKVWRAIAPHMADGASIEFSGEGNRWRIRWEDGRVFEDHIEQVIWKETREITAP